MMQTGGLGDGAIGGKFCRRQRLPRKAYLRKRAEFDRVRQEGIAVHGKLMVVTVLKQGPHGLPKFGVVTSRKVGPAVVRNRVRRRLREIIRLRQKELPMGIWLVIVAKRAAADARYSDLGQEWERLVERALTRIDLPMVKSQKPGTLKLTNEMIADHDAQLDAGNEA